MALPTGRGFSDNSGPGSAEAFGRAATLHERAAHTHELAHMVHSRAERVFLAGLRFGAAARERRLVFAHLQAASSERQKAVLDWSLAQRASELDHGTARRIQAPAHLAERPGPAY